MEGDFRGVCGKFGPLGGTGTGSGDCGGSQRQVSGFNSFRDRRAQWNGNELKGREGKRDEGQKTATRNRSVCRGKLFVVSMTGGIGLGGGDSSR
jgi:hypothetical protein